MKQNILAKFTLLVLIVCSFIIPNYAITHSLISFDNKPEALANSINPNHSLSKSSTDVTVNAFFQNEDVILIWDIPKDAKLYRDRISIELIGTKNERLGKVHFPKAQQWNDPILGPQLIYTNQLTLVVPLYSKNQIISPDTKLRVIYQACFKENCLPFQHNTFKVLSSKVHRLTDLPPNTPKIAKVKLSQPNLDTDKESSSNNHFSWSSLFSLLGFGLLLSFTPCVLPMLPIISGIVLGQGDTNKLKGFLLSLTYVLGMAVTYTLLGIMIALLGASFQGMFQTPAVLILTAILFVLLACSMFDIFHIQLPQKAQSFIHSLQEKPKSGSLISAFLFGVIASLIVSPCTSAPLISILSIIAQSGDWIFGGLSLFTLAIGMGIPLILIGTGLGYFVPKVGLWMNDLKYLIGVFMLIIAVWLLARILPGHITLILYSIILIGYAVFLGAFESSEYKFNKLKRAFGLILFLYGISLFVGAMMGNQNLLKPLSLSNVLTMNTSNAHPDKEHKATVVYNQQQLNTAIKEQQAKGNQVLLDFYARWCADCHLVSQLLKSKESKALLEKHHISLIKVDASDYSSEINQILKKYSVIGFPTLILLNQHGDEINRHSGHLSSKDLTNLTTSETQ